MARSLERIERDLAEMDQTVAAIVTELQDTYTHYLSSLGQAMQQQAIMVVYHICTQGYPDQFLGLDVNQRQRFQEEIHQMTKQARSQVGNLLADMPPPTTIDHQDQDFEQTQEDESQNLGEIVLPQPVSPPPSQHPDELEAEEKSLTSELAEQMHQIYMQLMEQREASSDRPLGRPLSLSAALLRWQAAMERKIAEVMVIVSKQANHLLREVHILPQNFPEKILEVAARSEGSDAIAGPPNLLNLTIEAVEIPLDTKETSDEEELEMPSPSPLRLPPMRIMAVRLRLSDIEFADPNLMAWRNKLRNILGQLKQLEQRYQQRLRERAIAQAESAWRSSWAFED